VLVDRTDRDLRPPAILVEDGIPEYPQFDAEHVLVDAFARNRTAQPEALLRQGDFDAVVNADRNPRRTQAKIARIGLRIERRKAHLVARAVSGDQRPGHQSATARPFNLGHAAGCEQPSAGFRQNIGTGHIRKEHKEDQQMFHAGLSPVFI